MAELNKETIKHLTRLCRIDCTEEEQDSLLLDLRKIIHYIEQLQTIDTENVPVCNHVLEEIQNVMRDDIVSEKLDREVFLSNAPTVVANMIRVPLVIKQS
jgi:aspartyl-tRNA(Asn)/glutamyl-tRNA(Gln) amidotransferase subunit C